MTKTNKLTVMLITICAIFTVFAGSVSASAVSFGNNDFVLNMYEECLGRAPMAYEMRYWGHNMTGRQIAFDFLHSEEFFDRDLTEAEIINVYYNVFFGTDATQSEIEFWEDRITVDDQTILFYGLINCPQFAEICEENDIAAGSEIFDTEAFTVGTSSLSENCGLTEDGTYVFYTYNPDGLMVYHEVIDANA